MNLAAVCEERVGIAIEPEEAATILEHHGRDERAERIPVAGLHVFQLAIVCPGRGVRRDAQRIGALARAIRPQRLEPRPRDVEVLELVELDAGQPIAPVQVEPYEDGLPLAALRQRPETMAD